MARLQLSISTLENTNFGDHGAMMRRDHEYVEGETLEDLVERVFPNVPTQRFSQHCTLDWIEIRVLVNKDGEVAAPAAGVPDSAKDPWA